jgi:hypothetical protein
VAAVMTRALERCIGSLMQLFTAKIIFRILTQKTGSEKFSLPDKPQNLIKTKDPLEHYGFIHR